MSISQLDANLHKRSLTSLTKKLLWCVSWYFYFHYFSLENFSFILPLTFLFFLKAYQNLILVEKKQIETLREVEALRVENVEFITEKKYLLDKMNGMDDYSRGLNKTLQKTREALQNIRSIVIECNSKSKDSAEIITSF